MDRDLEEVSITRLQSMYVSGKYTVAQVTQWYLDRITRYDGVYKAFLHVDAGGAKATSAAEDAAKKSAGARFQPPPLWGIPIVVKANTSVKGLVTSSGWEGYLITGHELVAPADATIVAKLKAAGAVILGQTNMPDFAESDTTISTAGGRTGNAFNWRFSPGGSSGGTATAVSRISQFWVPGRIHPIRFDYLRAPAVWLAFCRPVGLSASTEFTRWTGCSITLALSREQ
jgi:Asp-tRNA(Asn)/Glu-tRNA(Gln) amidotransferase A subunit family amidase